MEVLHEKLRTFDIDLELHICMQCACAHMVAQSGTVGVSEHRMAKKCHPYQCGGRESVLVCG